METIHLSLEKKNRGGKTVTLLKGFTRGESYLEDLAGRIKRSCGTGGTIRNLTIEIQGDFRSRIRDLLLTEGFRVKG